MGIVERGIQTSLPVSKLPDTSGFSAHTNQHVCLLGESDSRAFQGKCIPLLCYFFLLSAAAVIELSLGVYNR